MFTNWDDKQHHLSLMQMVWPASDNEYFKTTKLMADNEYFKSTKVDDYLAHSIFPYISLLIKTTLLPWFCYRWSDKTTLDLQLICFRNSFVGNGKLPIRRIFDYIFDVTVLSRIQNNNTCLSTFRMILMPLTKENFH